MWDNEEEKEKVEKEKVFTKFTKMTECTSDYIPSWIGHPPHSDPPTPRDESTAQNTSTTASILLRLLGSCVLCPVSCARMVSNSAGKVSHGARKVSIGAWKVSHGNGKMSHGAVKVSHGAGKVSHGYETAIIQSWDSHATVMRQSWNGYEAVFSSTQVSDFTDMSVPFTKMPW